MEEQQPTQQTQIVPAKKGLSTTVKVLIGCGACSVIAIILVVIISAASLFGVSKVVESVASEAQKTEEANNTNFANPKAIKTPVRVSNIEWTLTSATVLGPTIKADNEYSNDCVASQGSTFIHITFTAKNQGDKMASTIVLNIYDDLKREFISYTGVYLCQNSNANYVYTMENINPGLEKEYDAYFEVPSDAKGFRVKVGDLDIFANKYDYISLGF